MGALLIVTTGPRSVATVRFGEAGASGERGRGPSVLVAGEPVAWWTLAELDYVTGEASDTLRALEGREVRIPGFIVPLQDFAFRVREFLLVPWAGACIHTPPPPPNQMVYVEMAGNQSVPILWWDPVWIHGRLEIQEVDSPYGAVSYRLTGTHYEPYTE